MKNKIKEDRYHHGDLRYALIEKGIEIINLEGESNFSLRKVATRCGVSNAAPYAHFKNREAFLSEVRTYIADRFYTLLKETIDNCLESSRILLELGKSYVLFFRENPLYYRFLFSIDNIDIDDYPPFGLFKSTAEKELKGMLGDKADDFIIHAKVIALWSLVHGLSSIVAIRGVLDVDNIEAEVELILGSINV